MFIIVLRIEKVNVMQTKNNNKVSLSALKFSLLTGQRPLPLDAMSTVDSVRKQRSHDVTVYEHYFIAVSSP